MILKQDMRAPDSLIDGCAGRRFWQAKNADENAMVAIGCEVPGVSKVDLEASRDFLAQLGIGTGPGLRTVMSALEGGAGIGRFTRAILTAVAEQVDVIEPIIKFTECLNGTDGIRDIFNFGLEEWHPAPDIKYDLIWNQGCICHLTDKQLVEYLRKCRAVLRTSSGLVIIKENISVRGFDIFDATDSTVTRHVDYERCNLRVTVH
ncbi:hypothetical protein TrVGV298_007117 [Trichoderma virens]|nr:hypothetical protein TrVGV298_007117 [Trichoderma virens]